MKRRLILWMLVASLLFPLSVHAGPPLDTLKGHVDNVIAVLKDPSLKAETAKPRKKEKIRTISEKMFDFSELSRRTLGNNWRKFSGDQQKEFIGLYQSLLEDLYADRILKYTDEKIVFKKENGLSEKTVEVQTSVMTKNADIPINYRMIQEDGGWRVYDVVIEGVSLISNYRSQFREILSKQSPEDLLDTLRKKTRKA